MVPDIKIIQTKIRADDLHTEKLPIATRRAFLYCINFPFLKSSEWYLAGGTALLLQVGHRKSVDLDFFTHKASFKETLLERLLSSTNKWATTLRENGTIFGTLDKAKMSFIAYPFFIPSPQRTVCGNVRMLIPQDIASMKIVAISQRGRKRDFIDLYWYCTHRESLVEVVKHAVGQYAGQEHNLPHILKSLTYFEDAESDPMPELFFKASWNSIKAYFKKEVAKAARQLLGIK